MMGSAERLAAALVDAFNTRVRIEQARGLLAQAHSISVDEALVLMRLYATTHQQALGDVAQAVIDHPASVSNLMSPRHAKGVA